MVLHFFQLVHAKVEERVSEIFAARDANGREYAVMTHEEPTKNHPGGENSKPSAERETRLYSTGADDDVSASQKLFYL